MSVAIAIGVIVLYLFGAGVAFEAHPDEDKWKEPTPLITAVFWPIAGVLWAGIHATRKIRRRLTTNLPKAKALKGGR